MKTYRGRPAALPYGFTATELLIVLAILALLATFGLPAFLKYGRQGKLASAQTTLRAIAREESRWYEAHKTYGTLSQLGYPVDLALSAIYLDKEGSISGNASQASIYRISVKLTGSGESAAYYLITAEPVNGQAKEADCGTLSLASTGQVGATGLRGESACWNK